MLKKNIKYTDFNGVEQEEDFYFNLSQAELTELEITHEGGFGEYLQRLIDSKNRKTVVKTIKEVISLSYGIRSADGKSFLKTEEALVNFQGSNAYGELFLEIFGTDGAADAFIKGILPGDLAAKVEAQQTTPGFRPGAETLPKSRREQLEAERAAQTQVVSEPAERETPPYDQ